MEKEELLDDARPPLTFGFQETEIDEDELRRRRRSVRAALGDEISQNSWTLNRWLGENVSFVKRLLFSCHKYFILMGGKCY